MSKVSKTHFSGSCVNNTPLTVGEFFSGIGGIRLAIEQAGFSVVVASEIDKACVQTYQDNFGDTPLGDITEIKVNKLPDFTVLAASTPCQSFSLQGKRKGLRDRRGQLIHTVFRIIDAKNPKVVFIENVKGMAVSNGGKALRFVVRELKRRGYFVHWKILKASDFGVPQKRERLFIVAFKENVPFSFPNPTALPAGIGAVLEKKVHENFFLSQKEIDSLVAAKARYDKKGHNFSFRVIEPLKPANTILASLSSLKKNLVEVPLDKKAPSSRGIFKNGNKQAVHLRILNHRECARLQGFPESFKLTASSAQSYKQLGNSVPVPVIREIFKEILVSLALWDKGVRLSKRPKAKPINPRPPKKISKPSGNNAKTVAQFSRTQNKVRHLALMGQAVEKMPPVFPNTKVSNNEKLKNRIGNWTEKDPSNHFMTPKWLIDFIRYVQPIELDAASSPEANEVHKFKRILTLEDNALVQPWKVEPGQGVFINPPYCGRLKGKKVRAGKKTKGKKRKPPRYKSQLMDWANKIVSEYQRNTQPIFVLVPARGPESKWFQVFFENATHIVFLKERLIHNDAISTDKANFASALVVFGGDQLGERLNYLSQLGECLETSNYRKQKEQAAPSTKGGAA